MPAATNSAKPATQRIARPTTRDGLRAEAHEYWSARAQQDWATMFAYQDMRETPDATLEQYMQWAEEKEPFRVDSFSIHEVIVDGEYGWVEMDVELAMRQFPDVPARQARRWDKWHVLDGRWMPARPQDSDLIPSPPPLRDLAEEPKLRARFEEAWAAMKAGDWETYAGYADPSRREFYESAAASGEQSQLLYLSHDVYWVEVIEDRGVVCFAVEFKPRDISTAQPQKAVLNDRWVKRDNEWYLDPRGPQE